MTNPLRLTLSSMAIVLACVSTGCQSSAQSGSALKADAGDYRVYIGTFTNAKSKGIYLMSFDSKSGKLSEPTLVAESPSPSFLALHPNHKYIYSVNEVNSFQGKKTGGVSAFAIDSGTGKLTPINQQSSAGMGPTHITIDPTGKAVLVANYAGGSVAALPVKDDGSLGAPSSIDQRWGHGPNPSRQDAPHAHSIYPDPNNRFVLSCDLGLDKVFVYRFDPQAATIQFQDAAQIIPESGPRHLAFHPSHKYVYVLNEMACAVTAMNYDEQSGALKTFQTISTWPDDSKGNKSTAEIFVHPNGKFVYASNRGDSNSIAIFSVDQVTGKLTFVDRAGTQGRTPRGFGIDPTGNWLIAGNQDTNTVSIYRIDQDTGKLQATGQVVNVPTPVCVTLVPKS
jgi:6-phosphogluconolactonase